MQLPARSMKKGHLHPGTTFAPQGLGRIKSTAGPDIIKETVCHSNRSKEMNYSLDDFNWWTSVKFAREETANTWGENLARNFPVKMLSLTLVFSFSLPPQCRRGFRRHLPHQRGGHEQWQLHLHSTGYFQIHLQNRHHLVSVRRPRLWNEIRKLDLQWFQGNDDDALCPARPEARVRACPGQTFPSEWDAKCVDRLLSELHKMWRSMDFGALK